jgi:hypothetical protein
MGLLEQAAKKTAPAASHAVAPPERARLALKGTRIIDLGG